FTYAATPQTDTPSLHDALPISKSRAVNFLLPYVQKIPNRILRSEWATRIAQQLRLEEPVLRAALSKAAAERRGALKLQPELVARDRKSTRLNSSHLGISYAVFC